MVEEGEVAAATGGFFEVAGVAAPIVGFVAADGVVGEAAFGKLEGAAVVVVGGLFVEVGEDAAIGGFLNGVPEEGDAAVGVEVGNFDGAPPCAWALIEARGKQRLAKASVQNIAAIVEYDLVERLSLIIYRLWCM